jgi:hypothetical protein
MLMNSWMKFSKLMALHKPKQPCWKKLPWQIVESTHFSTLATLYNYHFIMYNTSKKHGTQLIPNVVWKFVYKDYLKAYPNPHIVEETLKGPSTWTFEGIEDAYF